MKQYINWVNIRDTAIWKSHKQILVWNTELKKAELINIVTPADEIFKPEHSHWAPVYSPESLI
jgi:hypothetical protein